MKKKEVPVSTLRSLLDYDPLTGKFTWKVNRRGSRGGAGSPALNYLGNNGYYHGSVDGKLFLAHRVAIAMVYGYWPPHTVDHINRDRTDNRILNLRCASRSENMRNIGSVPGASSRLKGVSWDSLLGKWRAQIRVGGKNRYIGVFLSEEDAHAAYMEVAKAHHGEFLRAA